MKKTITLLLALGAITALIGCNTVDGVGEDLEETGEAIESGNY